MSRVGFWSGFCHGPRRIRNSLDQRANRCALQDQNQNLLSGRLANISSTFPLDLWTHPYSDLLAVKHFSNCNTCPLWYGYPRPKTALVSTSCLQKEADHLQQLAPTGHIVGCELHRVATCNTTTGIQNIHAFNLLPICGTDVLPNIFNPAGRRRNSRLRCALTRRTKTGSNPCGS